MKDKDKIAYLFEEAVNNFNAGDYQSAIAAWKEILKYDPGNQQAELGIRVAGERLTSDVSVSGVQVSEGMDAVLPGEGAPGYPSEPGYSQELSGWGLPGGGTPGDAGGAGYQGGQPYPGEQPGYGQQPGYDQQTPGYAPGSAGQWVPPHPQQAEYGAAGAGAYGEPAPPAGTDYGTPAPDYGTPTPDYGTPAPDYGAPAPDYGAPAPDYGAPPSGDQVLEDLDLPGMDLPDLESGIRPGASGAPPPAPGAPLFPEAPADSADQTLISSGVPPPPPAAPAGGGIEDLGPLEDLDLPVPPPPSARPAKSAREEPFGGGQREFEVSGANIPLAAPRPASGTVSASSVDEVEDLEDLGEGAPVPPPPPPTPRAPRPTLDSGLDAEAIPTVPLREPRPAPRPAPMYRPAAGGLDTGLILKIAIPAVALVVLVAGGYFGYQAVKKLLGGKANGGPVASAPTGPVVEDSQVLLVDCEAATESKNWDDAIAVCCDRFLKTYPKDEKAKRLCAEARAAKERPPEFNKRFEQARDRFCRDESWESALLLLGELRQNYPRYAGELRPWIVDGYVNWGIEKLQIRQPREAVEFGFRAAQELAPEDENLKTLRQFAEAWMDRKTTYDYDRQVQGLTFRKKLCK